MNLPGLPLPPKEPHECSSLYERRLEHGGMPFPRMSQLLIAYMAWPNSRKDRDCWMAANTALFLLANNDYRPFERPSPQPSDQVAFELFGGVGTLVDASVSHMLTKLIEVQERWPHVADVLQTVVDIHYERRGVIPGGASVSKAQDLLRGYSALPRKSRLAKDWSDFRDVSHLIAAAAAVASASGERFKQRHASAVLAPALLVPEVVVALAHSFQEFGLGFHAYRQTFSILPADTLWRVPTREDFPRLSLPVRRLSDVDLRYLTTVRRARRKA